MKAEGESSIIGEIRVWKRKRTTSPQYGRRRAAGDLKGKKKKVKTCENLWAGRK